MNDLISPTPWNEFFDLWFYYITLFGLILHLVSFILGCVVMAVITAKKPVARLESWMVRWIGFTIILWIVSGGFNALWGCLIWGNLYWDSDVDSPEGDFSPFFPTILSDHGKFLVGTPFLLQMVWLLFAAMSWGVSFMLYRFMQTILRGISGKKIQVEGGR
ncbi:MAG TPA: hypothetical protein VL981_14935 [Candidatus Methylacidiphilales bacterium]|nr:hypothetical protein [Candidatus Methylacidiphilales bacterium]